MRRTTWTWQLLILFACLFALSIFAPAIWKPATKQPKRGRVAGAVTPPRTPLRGAWRWQHTQPAPRVAAQFVEDGPAALPLLVVVQHNKTSGPVLGEPTLPADVAADGEVDAEVDDEADVAEFNEDAAPDADPTPPSWSAPQALLERLQALAENRALAPWARETEHLVRQLAALPLEERQRAAPLMDELRKQVRALGALMRPMPENKFLADMRRAGHALHRRLDIWEAALPAHDAAGYVAATGFDRERLAVSLAELDVLTRGSQRGAVWRKYLMFDALEDLRDEPEAPEAQARLAARVLTRLKSRKLTPPQRRFVTTGPVADLSRELRRLAYEPVDVEQLLTHLERYEATSRPSDAVPVAADVQQLAFSPSEAERLLARRLEGHFRNANLRVAVSQKLLGRLVPDLPPRLEPLHEQMNGVPVQGQSLTTTDLSLRLLPGGELLRVQLMAEGEVHVDSRASRGAVTAYNQTVSAFAARKIFEINADGIRTLPTSVEVSTRSRLRDLETDYDGIPLLGGLVRSRAYSEYDGMRGTIRRETDSRITSRATELIDGMTAPVVARLNQQLVRDVLGPLEELALEPMAIVHHRDPERMAVRVRLAADDQLGAHTPRPRALSNSVASMQVHQSVFNNIIGRLSVNGGTYTLPELYGLVTEKLNLQLDKDIEELSEDARVTFAEEDPVCVYFEDGRVKIVLHIAQLVAENYAWTDVMVNVFYRPRPLGPAIEMARDGVIQIKANGMTTRSQFILRGMFSSVFQREKTYPVLHGWLTTDGRLGDVQISQVVLEDGWLGLSLGPRAPAPPAVISSPLKRLRLRR